MGGKLDVKRNFSTLSATIRMPQKVNAPQVICPTFLEKCQTLSLSLRLGGCNFPFILNLKIIHWLMKLVQSVHQPFEKIYIHP